MSETLLNIKGIVKRFGGLTALNDVGLHINKGEVYGLIGPNGAGKTTLFNVLTGLYVPDEGEFTFAGHNLFQVKPDKVVKAGIARTFQNIRLFGEMTALENVMIGRHTRSHAGAIGSILRTPRVKKEEAAIAQKAYDLLEYVGISDVVDEQARNLSYGHQRRLEIARALACEPKLLALDEPAAGMNPSETEGLKHLMSKIRDDGVTILLIEHDVKLMMELCDRIAVLDYGQKIAEDFPEGIRTNPRVIEAYLGASHE
ncbi:ABC transporter ATP-binding protein [Vitreoscilla massiliensis]|uniref:ABC transporter ATP-binding protein n=1 Tax=Vitreoscilla massiliensis TaxID=1689272 RepID=A0ABY4E095_9NEIS|nr:ABC transporter ATP-binding protein [Vitreoscilla massiliensis]UOO89214.1 ABC transporter ATP-binding protein [Vitreoscilla massiliensis]